MMIDTPYGQRAARATDAFEKHHCAHFDMLCQVYMNNCPLMGLAFPAFAFHKLGFLFDETLTTTEDWDFFMRAAFCLGVCDIKEPTAVYRIWENAESSRTVHDKDEWQKNYDRIQEKFLKVPIVLNKGYSVFLRQIVVDRSSYDSEMSREAYNELHAAYLGVTGSKSWRITAPLRACLTGYKRMRERLAARRI